jgi:DNA topoisomerase II
MKVVELAGIVSGLTAYQHGETSLQGTIVGLAQTFVGSNNINCLEPSGNFGSRLQGGSDCASARYIYTRLSPFARKLFHQADEPLLTYNTDDGKNIEPEVYAPVVPMVLVNGADGIGTGWSSSIPNYNPEDIVANIKRRMQGEEWQPMQPWFRGFKGTVTKIDDSKFKFTGIVNQSASGNEVEITELPIRVWTQDFKDKLEEIIKAEKVPSWIKDYKDYNNHKDVNFVIQMEEKHMQAALKEGLEERFKLTKTMGTTNLVAFDPEGRITKYASVQDIMEEFFRFRLQMYAKRKEWLLSELQKDLRKFTNQARFIQMIINRELSISKKKKAVLIAELKKLNFDAFPKVKDAAKAGETEPVAEGDDEEQEEDVAASSYDYLLGMPLWSLTQERIDRLQKQIGDKEAEIDILMKKSKEDLWNADLDDFIDTWRNELEDEKQRQKASRQKGRRASKKFTTAGKPTKKRKGLGDMSDDSDFEVKKAKKSAPAPKGRPLELAQSKLTQGKITSFTKKLVSLPPKTKALQGAVQARYMYTDGASDPIDPMDAETDSRSATASQAEVKPKKTTKPVIKDDSDSDVVITKPAARNARAAAKKTKYTIASDSDSDSDNGDGLLADLGTMVKGLPNKSTESLTETRPLFSTSTSRPSSSHEFKIPSKPAAKLSDGMSDDETDYAALAPPMSPRRSILVTNKENTVMDISDDDKPIPAAKPKKAAAGRPKKDAESKPAAKKPAAKQPAPKKTGVDQSPIAKAYAKRLEKAKKVISDDEDDLANDLLDSAGSESDVPKAAVARPARRAVAAKKKPTYFDDSDDELLGGDSDEESEGFEGEDSD